MMKKINWKNVPDQVDFERLQPGGYVCKITLATDVPQKEYLKMEYDIAQGPQSGYYNELYKAKGFWGGTFYRSYKEKAQSMFKGFLTAVKESNTGFVFEDDEKRLEGKLIGLVLAEEEYRGNDGKIKKRLYVAATKNINKILSGDFTVPELKKLDLSASFVSATDVTDDDVPF